jgi:hypothetical protein
MGDLQNGDRLTHCELELAAGRLVTCPGDRCVFWEPGGAVLPGRCRLEQLDLRGRGALADYLLALRARLEAVENA